MKPFNHYVREEDLVKAIGTLAAFGDSALARKWQGDLDEERDAQAATAAALASLAEYRATRAAEHLLTERQANALAAIRAGQSPYYTWETYAEPIVRGDGVKVYGWWHRSRSMGGAVNRMVETLKDEGLIEPKRWTITAAGAERLEAWEAKHKKRLGEPLPAPSIPELMQDLHAVEAPHGKATP